VVDSIHIFTGQRYSVILDANQAVNNYWIRAQPFDTTVVNGINMAILRYAGATVAEPTTTSKLTNPMLETNLHPLVNPGAPGQPQRGGVDVALDLKIAYDPSSFSYSINGAKFIPPSAPVLLQILSGARSAHELLPAGSVYTLPRNKTIEVSIAGGSDDSPVRNRSPPIAKVTDDFLLLCSILSICTVYVPLFHQIVVLITNTFPCSIHLMSSEALEVLSITTTIQCAVS
jgi:Multicopper oxidase